MKSAFLIFWRQRNAREQKTLRIGAVLLLILLGYALLWHPLMQARSRLQSEVPLLRQSKLKMMQQTAEIARLKALPPIAPDNDMRAAMANATLRSNFPSPLDVQSLGAGRLRIAYASTTFEAWLEWSRILQSESRIRIESADIRALPEPGKVKIEAVLASSGAR